MVVGIVDAPPPAAAAATEAAAVVPPPRVPVEEASPFLAVSPSLEMIVAAEHAHAVEAARDEAAYSELRRHNKEERFARLRNAETRGVDERLDARGLIHQPHEPFGQPGLYAMREYVANMQDSHSDAANAAALHYSPGKRQFADTPVKYIRPSMRGYMGSSVVSDNGADVIKKWHETYDNEPHYW